MSGKQNPVCRDFMPEWTLVPPLELVAQGACPAGASAALNHKLYSRTQHIPIYETMHDIWNIL